MSVRAKFKVESITTTENGSEIRMVPVIGGTTENEQFFKWTPYGELKMGVVSDATAAQFTAGQQFYIDFTPAA